MKIQNFFIWFFGLAVATKIIAKPKDEIVHVPTTDTTPPVTEPYGGFYRFIDRSIEIRNDAAGSGYFHASRDSGSRLHAGIDILISESEEIYMPIDGYITRVVQVYKDTTEWKGIEIQGVGIDADYKIKIFYCLKADWVQQGEILQAGVPVAYAQAIHYRYPNTNMKDHLHIEIYFKGQRIDPTDLILNLA